MSISLEYEFRFTCRALLSNASMTCAGVISTRMNDLCRRSRVIHISGLQHIQRSGIQMLSIRTSPTVFREFTFPTLLSRHRIQGGQRSQSLHIELHHSPKMELRVQESTKIAYSSSMAKDRVTS